jgi:NADPH2:quinone reductase
MSVAQVPVPVAGPGQALVEVRAAALNFPDVLMARGQYQERPALPFTPGIELCGTIAAVGQGVDRGRLGERVIGTVVLPFGALAGSALAQVDDLHPAPQALADAEAAALHVAYQTAWFALNRRAALRVGETLLVNAAAGGVGSAAVQLATAAGARVIGVVGGPHKVSYAEQAGADVVIDRTAGDVVASVRELTAGAASTWCPTRWRRCLAAATKVIAFEGRIVGRLRRDHRPGGDQPSAGEEPRRSGAWGPYRSHPT